ncbi:hypothetical protein [Yersinia bercovieri]|uniref:hypothetical protein n=1 Tax=Yersinia bercovieri TaxID=634 RepID=UPI0011A57524|nr:hypothetical protein [Yersinia bercovieri]
MKELDSFTVERLEEITELKTLSFPPSHAESAALARIALAAKRAEPVAWEVKGYLCHSKEKADSYIGEPVPLYEAPQLNSPEIPEGWKLVPIELTAEMAQAAGEAHEGESYLPYSIYRAMLAAAPEKENG